MPTVPHTPLRNHAESRTIVIVRSAFVVTLLVSLAIASPASAYVRTTVDGFPDRPIFWMDRAIGVELASGTSMDVSPADLRDALDRSLATWTRAGGCTDVVLTDLGEASGTTTNLDGGPLDHHNRIVVRETDWPSIVAPETLALTTILYDRSSGAILDSDTDMNGVSHAFSTSDPPPSDHDDVQNTLTHEMGHLLGFAHSPVMEATMFAMAAPGETSKRDLATDDIDAVCDTYPTGAPTPTTIPMTPTSGCSVSRDPSGIAMWIAIVAVVSWRSRSRSRRECPASRADAITSGRLRGPLPQRSLRAARRAGTVF